MFVCVLSVFASGAVAVAAEASNIPDHIYVTGERAPQIASKPYISISVEEGQAAAAARSINCDYCATAELFGILPLKTIKITQSKSEYVELCGTPVGVRLFSDGIVVAGLSDVVTTKGVVNPGKSSSLKVGDIIKEIDGEKAEQVYDMLSAVENSNGEKITLLVQRKSGKKETLTLTPALSLDDGCYRAGIWIKETSSGIGMLTFVTIDHQRFGGLGHAICDSETGGAVAISGGELLGVELAGVVPGAKGSPGELIGTLADEKLGDVTKNCKMGVYGMMLDGVETEKVYRVAMKQELKEGAAQMLTTLPGEDEADYYNVVIEKINYDTSEPTKNLIIKVTDERLLNATGGIVQGMSGSPIIQSGAFVAAVTHVFVNNPAMGYAIFAQNMLECADVGDNSTNSAA